MTRLDRLDPEDAGGTATLAFDYSQALVYLTSHPDLERGDRLPSELNLDRTHYLLDALGHPERSYPSILIAGTKGKGSTAAMIERALRSAGYRTGLYTQPHLHTMRERVRFEGQPIEPEDFAAGIERLRHAAARSATKFTAYELMTTMALERFSDHAVDVAVLEVGLGGRLDSTNVVAASLSILTSISLDHTRLLGDTLAAIAGEKADIIKTGRSCISAPQHPEAMAVIRKIADRRGAPLLVAGESGARWEQTPFGGWNLLLEDGCRLTDLHPSLRGGFQRINSAVAATALEVLSATSNLQVDPADIRTAIEEVVWPGRFEVAATAPPLILDGAHNVESARRLREAIHEEFPGWQPIYVLGIASDKDQVGIIRALCSGSAGELVAPPPAFVVATAARHPRAASPEALAGLLATQGVASIAAPAVAEALNVAARQVQAGHVLVVTGSLHVVAEARVALGLAPGNDEDPFDPWVVP